MDAFDQEQEERGCPHCGAPLQASAAVSGYAGIRLCACGTEYTAPWGTVPDSAAAEDTLQSAPSR